MHRLFRASRTTTAATALGIALAGCASTPAAPAAAGRESAIDALMRDYAGNVPGACVLVAQDGRVVFRKAYGMADLEAGIAATPATNYRLASVSKAFTAAAVLLLAQDGRLAIDDPVKRWLPSLPSAADRITLRQLLNHTSGVLDYEDLMAVPYPGQILDAGVLAILEDQDRLYFPPGSQYRYSNSGYALLALVVERASGQAFPAFLRSRIFQPLGMANSLARVDAGPAVPHRAYGYTLEDGRWNRTDQSPYSAVLGDGGVYSSIEDMARWDAAWNDDRLFTPATRALAMGREVQADPAPAPSWYGMGWRVTDDGGRQWHDGESIGFRNSFQRWPAQRISVVVLSNRDGPTPSDLAQRIGALFLSASQSH